MAMAIENVVIQIPEKVKSTLLKKLTVDVPSFPYHIDSFLYIFSKIVQMPMYNNRFKHLNMVPLSSIILRSEIGKHYKRYLEYLIAHNFIDTDNHYIVSSPERDGKCKCYGLTPKYRECALEKHTLSRKSLIGKILSWKEEYLGKHTSDEMLGKLYNMMEGFSIDIESAEEYLYNLKSQGKITQRKINIELEKCRRINSKNDSTTALFITKDSYNRVHTNFTNLSKHIREHFLYLHGKRVIGIDIVSSQASLLYSLMDDYVGGLETELTRQQENPFELPIPFMRRDLRDKYVNKKNFYTGDGQYDGKINRSVIDIPGKDLNTIVEQSKRELKKFRAILLAEGIYEYFQSRWDLMHGEDCDRKFIKKQWITYVFGRGKTPVTEKMHFIWEHDFPYLSKILMHFKEGDYKALAHTLQRKESSLMFEKVCPEITKRLNIDYCTVHDSIIVDADHADDVACVFDEILESNGMITSTSY